MLNHKIELNVKRSVYRYAYDPLYSIEYKNKKEENLCTFHNNDILDEWKIEYLPCNLSIFLEYSFQNILSVASHSHFNTI